MRPATPLFRCSAGLAVAGLLLGPLATPPALAQPAPPPQAGDAASLGDPPARVGRLAELSGTVSFRTADADHWDPATPNYPLTSGNSLWTEPQAGAEIEVGASRIALDGSTEFDIDRLDDRTLAAAVGQGRTYLNLRDPAPGDVVTLRTPRGTVTIGQAGRYLLAAGDAVTPTLVTSVDGVAQIYAEGLSLTVSAGQTATITGSDHFDGTVGPQAPDPFLAAQLARERPAPFTRVVAPPPVVRQMTGVQPLLETGEWADVPQYGQIWYPPVAPGWVPYRNGHWVWVAPWGWTWVDAAPWGFAPFHYGRWVEFSGRWGWVPAEREAVAYDAPPVYAPALVSWVGVAGGAAVGLAAGLAIGAAVGWIPLGPREPYRPWYHASPGYFGRVNRPSVVNVTNITNVTTVNTFVNRGAGSFGAPGAVAGGPRPGGQWQGLTPQMLAASRPVSEVPVRPTLATPGITPGVARQVSLAPAPAGFTPRPVAPGPAVVPHVAGGVAPGAPGPHAGGPAGFRPGLPRLASPGAGRPAPTPQGAAGGAVAPAAAQPGPAGSQPGRALPGHPAGTAAPTADMHHPSTAQPAAPAPHQPSPSVAAPAQAVQPGHHPAPEHVQQPAHAAPPSQQPQHAAPAAPQPQHAAPAAPQPSHPSAPPPHAEGQEHHACPHDHPKC
jgi:hypothetical protein